MTSPDDATDPDVPTAEPRPGEVERVPLKVVPIFVQPIEDEPADDEPEESEEAVEVVPRRRTVIVALSAIVLALATVGTHVAAIVVATAGDFPLGTLLGYVAVGLSIAAMVAGIAALVVGRARGWAVAAIIGAVLANPLVLLTVLQAMSGLQTT